MIGIRREDKNRWERRAPLTPDHVAELTQHHGVAVCVEPSGRRAFPDEDYRRAGAVVSDDLGSCSAVLGVKEIPPEKMLRGATYAYFSHVTKGQPKNMPALRRLIELGCTLLDYERVVDPEGRRFIFFGRHAGYAGMIDTLWALGRKLAAEGLETPLERIRLAHDYAGLDEATHHVSRIGDEWRHAGIPASLRPLVVGFTGSGNVARGAQEIYDRLPTLEVLPEEVPVLAGDRNALYKVVFGREHRFERVDGGPTDPDELSRHPERYRNGLARWLPYLTALVHGAFWLPGQPRLVTRADLQALWKEPAAPRLRVIADISCDIGGGIEVNVRATTPGEPAYVHEVATGEARPGVEGRGPVIVAVDNLPCQLPVESSAHFGDHLIRYVPGLASCSWDRPLDRLDLPPEIRRGIVVHRGELTSEYCYLRDHLPAG